MYTLRLIFISFVYNFLIVFTSILNFNFTLNEFIHTRTARKNRHTPVRIVDHPLAGAIYRTCQIACGGKITSLELHPSYQNTRQSKIKIRKPIQVPRAGA